MNDVPAVLGICQKYSGRGKVTLLIVLTAAILRPQRLAAFQNDREEGSRQGAECGKDAHRQTRPKRKNSGPRRPAKRFRARYAQSRSIVQPGGDCRFVVAVEQARSLDGLPLRRGR
jgi:hypothetical protein